VRAAVVVAKAVVAVADRDDHAAKGPKSQTDSRVSEFGYIGFREEGNVPIRHPLPDIPDTRFPTDLAQGTHIGLTSTARTTPQTISPS